MQSFNMTPTQMHLFRWKCIKITTFLVGGFSPTHLNNMFVKLEIIPPGFRGENKKETTTKITSIVLLSKHYFLWTISQTWIGAVCRGLFVHLDLMIPAIFFPHENMAINTENSEGFWPSSSFTGFHHWKLEAFFLWLGKMFFVMQDLLLGIARYLLSHPSKYLQINMIICTYAPLQKPIHGDILILSPSPAVDVIICPTQQNATITSAPK